MTDFFTKSAAQTYDEKNSRLAPIADNMHFLIRLIVKDLPAQSRILCVGVGTGAEILSLAKEYPEWSFVGVDPSADMLAVCRERLEEARILDRCQLVEGYVSDIPVDEPFDAVLSVLVGHFVPREERKDFYQNMHQRLKDGGYFINTEISFNLDTEAFPSMLQNWKQVQALMGATPESLDALPNILRNVLTVLPPTETEEYMRAAGFALPIQFFQSFMIVGWYGRRED